MGKEEKSKITCSCGKRIADRDNDYIYLYCRNCKAIHRIRINRVQMPKSTETVSR